MEVIHAAHETVKSQTNIPRIRRVTGRRNRRASAVGTEGEGEGEDRGASARGPHSVMVCVCVRADRQMGAPGRDGMRVRVKFLHLA